MPMLAGYLLGLVLLLSGGLFSLQWLVSPDTNVAPSKALVSTGITKGSGSRARPVATPYAVRDDAADKASDVTQSVVTAIDAVPESPAKVAVVEEAVPEQVTPRPDTTRISQPPAVVAALSAGDGKANAEAVASAINKPAIKASPPKRRVASNEGKRSLGLKRMTLRTVAYADGRTESFLIPFNSGRRF